MRVIKNRLENIELLRIFSMFLVMLIHYNFQINGQPDHKMLSDDVLKTISVLELQSIDIVCVNCFILISGFFGIRWKWRSFSNFVFQVFFWVLFSYIFGCLIGYDIFSYETLGHKILNFLSYNWFILSYLGLYLFAPVLNKFIEHSTERELVVFTFVFYLFQTIFGYVMKVSPEFNEGMSFVSLIGLYFLGTCMRRVNSAFFSQNKYLDLAVYLCLGFLLTLISIIAITFNVNKSVYGYMNPIVLIQSIYLFLFFTKLKIKGSWITFFSSSAFAVYLFHYNQSIYSCYLEICAFLNYEFGFAMVCVFLCLLFIFVVFVDKIRAWVFNKLFI